MMINWRFLYLRETKSWKSEEREGGENVHLLTHAPARGMGKKYPKVGFRAT